MSVKLKFLATCIHIKYIVHVLLYLISYSLCLALCILLSLTCFISCLCLLAVWCDGVSQRGLHSLRHLSLRAARPGAPPALRAVVTRGRRSAGQTQRGPSQHAVATQSHGCPGPHAHLHVHW